MKHKLLISAILCLLCFMSTAQDAEAWKKEGESFFAAQKYSRALEAYLKSNNARPGDTKVLSQIGICYYQTNKLDEALLTLQKVVTLNAVLPVETFLFLAKTYHAKLQFQDAVRMYKVFLKNSGKNHPLNASVKDDIIRCATGMRVRRSRGEGYVVNLGEFVNAAGDDFKPVLSPGDEKRIYYSSIRPGNSGCTYDGPCKSDIFYAEVNEGDWSVPRPLSVFLNSVEHDVALDFDESGSILYFFRGKTLHSGDILVDTFRENALERTLFAKEIESPMRPWEGDAAPFFFNDTILLFASRRAGGYGGLDLYVTTFADGKWKEPENLGSTINSACDETSPFLARDGRTLYFSTNEPHRSIGGLDVQVSTYLDKAGKWPPPQNAGIPVNSAGDDTQLLMNEEGTKALFSSSRKEGFGGLDIYMALFDQPRREQVHLSWPAAFHLVPAYEKSPVMASEGALPPGDIFESGEPIVIQSLYYPAAGESLTSESLLQLNRLSQLMQKFPDAKIILAAHCDKSDPAFVTCQNILKEAVGELRKNDTPLNNLLLRNAGFAWPATEASLPEARRLNRRIDVFIANQAELPYEIRFKEPLMDAPAGKFFRKAMSSLCYRIQIPLDDRVSFDYLLNMYQEGMVDDYFDSGKSFFVTGLYLTFFSAEEMRKELAAKGFPQAVVTPYLNGREISKEEAASHVAEFPDLENFTKN